MIEIRELVIRATVENSTPEASNTSNNAEVNNSQNSSEQDKIDMILKIIKEKKER